MKRPTSGSRGKRRGKGSPGRPVLPREQHRSVSVRVRLSPAEIGRLRSRAEGCCLPLATYIRTQALQGRIRPPSIPRANLRYVGELNRLGNNFNQLLVLIHTNRAPLGLLSTLRALQQLVTRVKAMMLGCQTPSGGTKMDHEPTDE